MVELVNGRGEKLKNIHDSLWLMVDQVNGRVGQWPRLKTKKYSW